MPAEQEGQPIPISGIHINLTERSITFTAADKPIAMIAFAPEGVIYFHATPQALLVTTTETTEREKTVTLSGRLKSLPKTGKPDARGNPTAWARLAAHEEGRDEAHIYVASFHRHTAPIALTLHQDDPVTVSGYPHLSEDPKRLDTFSVVNL